MKHQESIAQALAILAALLVGSLTSARPPEDPPPPPAEDEVRKLLKDLKEELADLRKTRELERQANRDQMNEIRDRLDRLERRVDRLSDTSSTRGALYNIPEPTRRGTIRLDNRLGVEARVTIDGVSYTIAPLSVRVLPDQPAGSFTYEVTAEGYGLTAPRRTTLASGERWTLTIY